MAKHKQFQRKDGSISYEELTQRQYDELTMEYWKTWLAAWRVRVKSEEALHRFVGRMEGMLARCYEDGAMFNQDDLIVPLA